MESTTSAIGYKPDQETLQVSVVRENRTLRSMWRVAGNMVATLMRQSSTLQLIEDVRGSIPSKPGSPAKYDGEYRRMGTRNIFVAVEPLAGKRRIKVTDQRKKTDFAWFIKKLIDQDYGEAKKVLLVLDNLNTHFAASFYETFSKKEADRILKKLQFYYTPTHGSWLNMAEIEINMMDRECLARRIGQADMLEKEIACWSRQRNKKRKKIHWSFTRKQADSKLSKYYVA